MATNNKNGLYAGAMGLPIEPGACVPDHPQTGIVASSSTFEPLDRQSGAGSNTLKRNPKMELSKTDLLRLLSYMEGELQAQSIVIAALKSERLKQMVSVGRYRPLSLDDPHAALLRDSVAERSGTAVQAGGARAEREMRSLADRQLEALDELVLQQRRMQTRMAKILKDAEEKHRKAIRELEEERRERERDTAQGDDIAYGLEMERTRLRRELELEKQAKKRTEKDRKKFEESVEEERSRQKQIVLLLLAERKKIIVRYVEERKRSEDLAQILSEEKARVDAMAEGLEEESKKSLRMEAELEKHVQQFEKDKSVLRARIAADERRMRELECELEVYKALVAANGVEAPETTLAPPTAATAAALETIGMPSSVAKVMQPTSTVTSVPVSGPTMGVAQTVHSSANVRCPVQIKTATAAFHEPVTNSSARSQAIVAPVRPPVAAVVAPRPPPKKGASVSRGAPPPIPPNKPAVPPKRDAVERRPSSTGPRPPPPALKAPPPVIPGVCVLQTVSTNSQTRSDGDGATSMGVSQIDGQDPTSFQRISGSTTVSTASTSSSAVGDAD